MIQHIRVRGSAWGLVVSIMLVLTACEPSPPPAPKPSTPVIPKNEVLLSADSPKRGMLVEKRVELSPAPVMEPVAGKLAYDESRTARISAPIAGRIVSAIPALGTPVKAHDALIELDSPELGQANEAYANALADQRLAEAARDRAKSLFEHGVLPRKELEQAENALAHARDDISRSLMHLQNLGASGDQINNRYWVRSPIAGFITERHVNPGMEVRPDLAEPLFVVSDLKSLSLWMNVFEKDLARIHLGTRVLVSVPAYPELRFPATVEYIDKLVDEATHTVKVRCQLDNPRGQLMPAMYATADIQSGARDKAVVVPLTALFTEGEGDQVFVRIGNGHYQQRDVKVRLRLKDRAVIASGLKPGETIVAEGALLLRTEEANEQTAEEPAAPK